jgi:hypothetical protein
VDGRASTEPDSYHKKLEKVVSDGLKGREGEGTNSGEKTC